MPIDFKLGLDIRYKDVVLTINTEDTAGLLQLIQETSYRKHYRPPFYFLTFPIDCLEAFSKSALGHFLFGGSLDTVPAVGCGSWRLEEDLSHFFPYVQLEKHREAPCLLSALKTFPDLLFRYKRTDQDWNMSMPEEMNPLKEPAEYPQTPFLLVTMKTGCSFFKVEDSSVSRIGGSCLGGSTYEGLSSLMNIENLDYEDTSTSLDLTVNDIYHGEPAPPSLNLPGHVIASIFCKATDDIDMENPSVKAASRNSLRNMIAVNTAQLAHLHAQLLDVKTVVFAFIQASNLRHRTFKILEFWNKDIDSIFTDHADLLASAGACLGLAGDPATYEENRFDETCTSLELSTEEFA